MGGGAGGHREQARLPLVWATDTTQNGQGESGDPRDRKPGAMRSGWAVTLKQVARAWLPEEVTSRLGPE